MNFDYTLYLVTDRQLMSCDSLTEAVEQAILGGCTMIQLREKELSSLEFYNQAVAVKQVTDKYHVLPAIKSAKAARMLAGGIYDKYSADQRAEIERIADIYLLDFRQAPIPHKEV